MDRSAQIKQALIEALGINPNLAITAEVVSIQNTTCTVKLISELVLTDVRLCATINESEDLYVMVPKVGSEVILISQTGKLSGLMVVKVDAVESISYKKGGFEFIVDGSTGKVTLKNESVNFGQLLSSLITEIQNAIILTPSGPGKIGPTTKAKLIALDTKFKTLLNSN